MPDALPSHSRRPWVDARRHLHEQGGDLFALR
jgi:hypothetical protein